MLSHPISYTLSLPLSLSDVSLSIFLSSPFLTASEQVMRLDDVLLDVAAGRSLPHFLYFIFSFVYDIIMILMD